MWLSDLQIVLPNGVLERGSICIADGRIAEIVEGPVARAEVQARGLTAIPGIIDMHGDMLEREIEPRPGARFPVELGLFELDKRLIANGVTTAYAAISFHPTQQRNALRTIERAQSMARAIAALRSSLLVDLHVHARFEITHPDVADALADLLVTGQVHLVSLTDHTPGQGQYRDIEQYIERIAAWRDVSRDEIAQQTQARLQRAQHNPPSWDVVRAVTRTAAAHGLPIASHDDDTAAKVDLVASLGATIAEFPVSLEAAQAARERGLHVVMGAPNVLRGGSHSGNLSAREAIEAGVVDLLAADYYPAALLQAAFLLADQDVLPLHEAVNLVTHNVARALQLGDRGSLAVGQVADIALIEPCAPPRVRGTLRRGVPIYWDTEMAQRSWQPRVLAQIA
jgi:alpha-D-ribose 1-methylphosphonate 5-triphosphate diphosphatase